MLRAASLACTIAVSMTATAAAQPVVRDLGDGARVDWTRGLLVARGAAAGDLRAPSPAVARLAAERRARQAARDQLRALAAAIPTGDGKKLGAPDGAAAARLDAALGRTIDLTTDYGTDGSVVLTCALPLEALRVV